MYEDLSKTIKESMEKSKIFEDRVREFICRKWNKNFSEKKIQIGDLNKKFDLVSDDLAYIGDVKYYKNIKVPAAKWSTIAEYVWFLEKTKAKHKFMIFGNGREVPERWLKRFGSLVKDVTFYFFDGERLEKLN